MQYTVNEMAEELRTLTEEEWGRYAFSREPLERKFTEEKKSEYIKLAARCGREEAGLLKEAYGGVSQKEILEKEGLILKTPDMPNGGGHVIFAQYEEPDKITIFMDCVKKAEELIQREGLSELFPKGKVFEILLSHELFHALEYKKRKTIFTQTEKIELWRKPFSNRSRIICLGEIAAMSFAGEMQEMRFSPYVLDVLLMYCYNKEAAAELYEEIMETAGRKEEKTEC